MLFELSYLRDVNSLLSRPILAAVFLPNVSLRTFQAVAGSALYGSMWCLSFSPISRPKTPIASSAFSNHARSSAEGSGTVVVDSVSVAGVASGDAGRGSRPLTILQSFFSRRAYSASLFQVW